MESEKKAQLAGHEKGSAPFEPVIYRVDHYDAFHPRCQTVLNTPRSPLSAMNFKALAVHRLEGAAAPSKLFMGRKAGAARGRLATPVKATFMPGNWAWNSEDGDSATLPLHGVLHSTKLPATLAGA